jgi:hypothetical protein
MTSNDYLQVNLRFSLPSFASSLRPLFIQVNFVSLFRFKAPGSEIGKCYASLCVTKAELDNMPSRDGGDALRQIAHSITVVESRKNLRVSFRIQKLLKCIGQGLEFVVGTLLLNLVANLVYDKGKQAGSPGLWTTSLASFLSAPYFKLTILALVLWLVK